MGKVIYVDFTTKDESPTIKDLQDRLHRLVKKYEDQRKEQMMRMDKFMSDDNWIKD